MQVSGDQNTLNLRLGEPDPLANLLAYAGDPHGVPAAVLIELLDQGHQHTQRFQVHLGIDGEIVALRRRRKLLDECLAGRSPRLGLWRRLFGFGFRELVVRGLLHFKRLCPSAADQEPVLLFEDLAPTRNGIRLATRLDLPR